VYITSSISRVYKFQIFLQSHGPPASPPQEALPVPVMSQVSQFLHHYIAFRKMYCNVFHRPTPRSSQWSFLVRFCSCKFVCVSSFCLTRTSYSTHPFLLHFTLVTKLCAEWALRSYSVLLLFSVGQNCNGRAATMEVHELLHYGFFLEIRNWKL